MARKSMTVAELASRAGLDRDEVLVALWEAGIDEVTDSGDLISASNLNRAFTVLGLPTGSDLRRPEYWRARLGMSEDEFGNALREADIKMSESARTLPKGAVSKLRRLERQRFGGAPLVSGPVGTQVKGDVKATRSTEPFEWLPIGHEKRNIVYLDGGQIRRIHALLVAEFASGSDPIAPPGVRDENLLESAVSRPLTSAGDRLKYPTVEMAAAALLHSLVSNHAFYNGNKRVALVSMAVMLYENGIQLTCSHDSLFKIVLQTAQHRLVPQGLTAYADREVLRLAEWIRDNSRPLEKGERILKWHQLKKVLSAFDVWWDRPNGVGNRINLYRRVERSRGLLRRRAVVENLSTQVHYQSDGADVAKNSIAKIRRELELDEVHGIDSVSFYGKADTPERVIVEYQRILRRLAKL